MLEFEFHPEAESELEESYRWYLRRSPRAASRFLDLVQDATIRACESPERWPSYLHGAQYVRISGYPFALVYLHESRTVYGIAVAHLKRRPGYWKDRLDDPSQAT